MGHHVAGDVAKARELYEQVLEIDPNQPVAWHLLGVIAHQQGNSGDAVDLIGKALSILPDYAEARYNLGNALKALNKFEEAVTSYGKAIAIKPDYAAAHNNLGLALKGLGKLAKAAASYGKALAIKPDFAEAHNNLGFALNELNQPQRSLASYQAALALKPNFAEVHYNLGNLFVAASRLNEAAACFSKALAIKPAYAEAHSNLIFLQDFIPAIDQAGQQAERKRWNDTFILPLADKVLPHSNQRDPDRLLRIGYVSADFHDHSACLGFAPLIIDHDRENFEVTCYDATLVCDDASNALRDAATHWRDIGDVGDEELAQIIRADGIDILVDLCGHTRGNRLSVFGVKPAPVQVSGIGHLAPGISTIDYRLTTAQLTPPGEEDIYPEKPVYLDTYFAFTAPAGAPDVCRAGHCRRPPDPAG